MKPHDDRVRAGGDSIASKKKTDLADRLQAIAESDDFPPTLSQGELNGKTFTLTGVRFVEIDGIQKAIGDIILEGKVSEAWLTGSKVQAQIEKELINILPVDLTMTRGSGQYDPYILALV